MGAKAPEAQTPCMSTPEGLKVKVATPCRARWDAMAGDERVRFCGECKKNVFNLSALTREQAEAIVTDVESTPCITYFQRADGTVLTADCEVGVAAARRRVARAVAAAGLLLAGAATLSFATPARLRSLGVKAPRVDLLSSFIDSPGVTLEANGGVGGLLGALWRGECATLDKPPAKLTVHKGMRAFPLGNNNAY
ncbi:MAG: hypothetical protein RL653_3874 [Pseudomonadota bacterium]|jgi:hypothetical protein